MLTQEQNNPSILPWPRSGAERSSARPSIRNSILATISPQDLTAIAAFLKPVVLRERMVLQEPKRTVDYIYFIESGLVSLRIVMGGAALETAVIGFRGAVGASVLFGGHLSTHQAAVLFPGNAFKIRVEDLRQVVNERRELRADLSRYVEALTLHCAQTGFCGVWHNREKRIASWLCLARHAANSDVLPVTHDYLSSVLGLPRPGITETLNGFAKQRLIRKMRGVLQIDEGKCLEQKACPCYKFVADAYASSGSMISA